MPENREGLQEGTVPTQSDTVTFRCRICGMDGRACLLARAYARGDSRCLSDRRKRGSTRTFVMPDRVDTSPLSERRYEVEVCNTCGLHVMDSDHAPGRCQNDPTHFETVVPVAEVERLRAQCNLVARLLSTAQQMELQHNLRKMDALAQPENAHLMAAAKVGRKLLGDAQADRARWIRAFNRLEKAVTNHIARDCIDSDELAHVHKAVMREVGPDV